MRLLICEGTCNPNLPHVDTAITREPVFEIVKTENHCIRSRVLSDSLRATIARLRYTLHVNGLAFGDTMWTCTVCQTTRRYGTRG